MPLPPRPPRPHSRPQQPVRPRLLPTSPGRAPLPSLRAIYRRLFDRYGPQGWWPGETPFEVMVGAILTQNTSWGNVARAIAVLRGRGLLHPRRLLDLPERELATLLRPVGYFRVKARRLRAFLHYFVERYNGEVEEMADRPTSELREELLGVWGVGPETADSILLYALGRPIFVVDAYTQRILERHGLAAPVATYGEIQGRFHQTLAPDVPLYNEYHALLVRAGKERCRPRPLCEGCPLSRFPIFLQGEVPRSAAARRGLSPRSVRRGAAGRERARTRPRRGTAPHR